MVCVFGGYNGAGSSTKIISLMEEIIGIGWSRGENENTDRAAYLHGKRVDRRVAVHDWIPAPGFLEGSPRDRVVAVLSWCDLQFAGALTSRSGR